MSRSIFWLNAILYRESKKDKQKRKFAIENNEYNKGPHDAMKFLHTHTYRTRVAMLIDHLQSLYCYNFYMMVITILITLMMIPK